ncbi:DUF4292 domain-containing protein [Bizionia gelidisalsuginis]|uniref:DUF4292 domain-containing protein n=2 Tax=Bizionia TaxID=283785 RepID=A0A8H2QEI1_9FLAO|nr:MULTISPECIES: DUF4292 domain-containing protein [Bizionia]TYB74233.1 DUF4292 domain-containing protein [Bizionia saleffrena]TYC15695.1 DUF4292 domain-containing protein [Bizionia gelidisalsuginis]
MNIQRILGLLLVGITLSFTGCKSTQTVVSDGTLNPNLSAKQLIKNNTKNNADFTTLTSRIKIEIENGNKSQSVNFSLRMEKGKVIWLSKLGIVKAMITPTRVAFYNKLDNTYFDGDFAYLSELLGTELNFNKVQSLLLGESLFPLDHSDYNLSIYEKSYLLQPKQQEDVFEIFLLLNPTHFKMDSQQIAQSETSRLLQIDYVTYQNVENEILPEHIKIIALEKDEELEINIEMKGINLNEDLRFPFKIPSGFDAITLE